VSVVSSGPGPGARFDCRFSVDTGAITGADGTASAIGWEGNHQGVVTCLGGTFFVQGDTNRDYGFGVYDGAPITWTDAEGYLPAQVTTFRRFGAVISITEFADRLVLGDNPYVVVYSRVAIRNPTNHTIIVDPAASSGLVRLDTTPDAVGARTSVNHDYAVAVDRFGHDYPWPDAAALASAGTFGQHYMHMRRFWNQQLKGIADIALPDTSMVDAYKSGFIYTQIARSADELQTGVNGYEAEYNHDVIGILATLFTQGFFSDAHELLLEARNVAGSQSEYQDGVWTYAWPWAIYLMKTGDVRFVRAHFASEGPLGSTQPSIEDTARSIAADRTGPGGIMESSADIDAEGYWTVDDFEALTGLAAYAYVAQRIGNEVESRWAESQYDGLLAATNRTLEATMHRFGLDYLPCSMVEPNTSDRCDNPEDANWAATFQFGKWAWDAQLLDAPVDGPGLDLIDPTYTYGFDRLAGMLAPNTFGGFPPDYFSTAYNAGYGSWALAGRAYRDQGILSYQFMIANDQSGPYSWWESSSQPSSDTPWTGAHPSNGQGSSPHAWGMAEANKVLLDSLAAQRGDGALIVGRGVPGRWLNQSLPIAVRNFPTTDGGRLDITMSPGVSSVSLSLQGTRLPRSVLFQLPAFVNNIARTSAGTVDEATGTIALPRGPRHVTVALLHDPDP
jgi:hypothetical protein